MTGINRSNKMCIMALGHCCLYIIILRLTELWLHSSTLIELIRKCKFTENYRKLGKKRHQNLLLVTPSWQKLFFRINGLRLNGTPLSVSALCWRWKLPHFVHPFASLVSLTIVDVSYHLPLTTHILLFLSRLLLTIFTEILLLIALNHHPSDDRMKFHGNKKRCGPFFLVACC